MLTKMLTGTVPLLLGVSQPICTPDDRYTDTCRLDIRENRGAGPGEITTDQQGVTWPANLLLVGL